jgi:SAM-dependent methyltransferase
MFNDAPIERFSFNFSVEGDEITSNVMMDTNMPDDQSMMESNNSNNQSFIPAQEHFITECSLAQSNNQSIDISMNDQSMDDASDQSINQSFNRTINDGECKLTDDRVTFCPGVTFLRPPINQKPAQLSDVLHDSDLTKHVYEGGLKLWECAIDLVQFCHEQSLKQPAYRSINLDYSSVLDLGCGHGFTGLYPLIYNHSTNQSSSPVKVTFQDLNAEVLIESTMNHVLLNVAHFNNQTINQSTGLINQRCRFVSGDWCSPSLMECLLNDRSSSQSGNHSKYSLILTSDTLYEPSVLVTLLSMIEQSLAADGVALIAAKRYYFGIGGGTQPLMERVSQRGKMEAQVEKVIEDGKSNIREIVSLRWKKAAFQ